MLPFDFVSPWPLVLDPGVSSDAIGRRKNGFFSVSKQANSASNRDLGAHFCPEVAVFAEMDLDGFGTPRHSSFRTFPL